MALFPWFVSKASNNHFLRTDRYPNSHMSRVTCLYNVIMYQSTSIVRNTSTVPPVYEGRTSYSNIQVLL